MPTVRLKKRAERSILRRHPWLFSGAIECTEGAPQAGDTVDVLASDGAWLARGAWSPHSQIAVRVWTFTAAQPVGAEWFRARLAAAIAARARWLGDAPRPACRLVNAESDGLPGLVVDRYAGFLVCQFLSAGTEAWRDAIVQELIRLLPATAGVYERSDVDVREKEGLQPCAGVLWGEAPPEAVEIAEGPCRYLVDIQHGHKTGFYLDQRDNRAAVAEFANGREILNAFSYSGAFAVAALRAGATRAVNVDSSAEALALAARNVALNDLDPARLENTQADVFQFLRLCRDARRQFDLIILDPPKFAATRGQVEKACRGYKDINRLAFKLLRPGGLLATFSCSGHVDRDLFQKVVADAALDAGCEARILRWLSQSGDHPCALAFPEGLYLKGLICQVGGTPS
ncbi:MAG: Ribosomal RNA large subunit methyltransferase I [Lentisphaerae bacterium ADurb.BinA184]|nr:MAG: Ribosomal RNA large subunit methyltransferase I [Lentisphaerae bacterium ADurb.BinA184]